MILDVAELCGDKRLVDLNYDSRKEADVWIVILSANAARMGRC